MSDADKLDAKVKAALDKLGVIYKVLGCKPELADTAAFCEYYGYSPAHSANTIIVAAKTDPVKYCACVVLATTKLDVNKKVCKLLEARKASFANADQTMDLTGMMIGGVTAFGLPKDLPIYVDSAVMQNEQVIMGGGNRTSKLLLDPAEMNKLPKLQVTEDLAIRR